jgi:hypothetical protein
VANKNLFSSFSGKMTPKTDSINEAGGNAYAFSNKQALAHPTLAWLHKFIPLLFCV